MSDVLNNNEVKKLIKLGKVIKKGLSCDINGTGMPCRSDRFQVLKDMIEYLKIHNYSVVEGSNVFESIVTHMNGKKISK